jgi:hypothetical protein
MSALPVCRLKRLAVPCLAPLGVFAAEEAFAARIISLRKCLAAAVLPLGASASNTAPGKVFDETPSQTISMWKATSQFRAERNDN